MCAMPPLRHHEAHSFKPGSYSHTISPRTNSAPPDPANKAQPPRTNFHLNNGTSTWPLGSLQTAPSWGRFSADSPLLGEALCALPPSEGGSLQTPPTPARADVTHAAQLWPTRITWSPAWSPAWLRRPPPTEHQLTRR